MSKALKLSVALVLFTSSTCNLVAQSSDWYLGHTIGTDWMGILKQAGFNGDTVCYPTFVCPQEPEGYRWFYDLDAHTGTGFELAVGRVFSEYRLELAVALASNDINQIFDSIVFLDGSPILLDEDSEYGSFVESKVGSISFGGLMLNTFRDFQISESLPFTTYVGFGVGVTRVEIEELVFRSEYTCIGVQCEDQFVSKYNVLQDTELEDWVWAVNVSAGLDYEINRRVLVGLKIAHRVTDDLVQSAGYLQHPIPDSRNTTTISELRSWSLSLSFKYKR